MISASKLRDTAESVLGSFLGGDFPYDKVADMLSECEATNNIRLSAYGYIMWIVDNYGHKCAYRNLVTSQKATGGYLSAAIKYRDDMPSMLINADTYVTQILSNVADIDICFKQLEGMTFPYVLYVLFAGSGQHALVERYRTEIEEQMRRYPSTLDLLPETYRKVGMEVLNEDTE